MYKIISFMNTASSGIQKLEGGNYDIDSIIKAIQKFTGWATRIGLVAAGAALVVAFVILAVTDVEQKARVKQQIKMVFFGVGGIILSLSLINLLIDLFV